MENNPIAYTKGNYEVKNNGVEDVFIFQSRKKGK